jgi:hypothetical protein
MDFQNQRIHFAANRLLNSSATFHERILFFKAVQRPLKDKLPIHSE